MTVYLHTIYQLRTPDGLVNRLLLPLEADETVEKLLMRLGIQIHEDSTLLVVNGKVVDLHYSLQDGDEFHVIPAISGGMIA